MNVKLEEMIQDFIDNLSEDIDGSEKDPVVVGQIAENFFDENPEWEALANQDGVARSYIKKIIVDSLLSNDFETLSKL